MFTISNKLRTIVALGAVGAALAGSGVASAATIARVPGSTGAPVVATAPTTITQDVDPSKVAGSPGVPGSTDEDCVGLANDINTLTGAGYANILSGDSAMSALGEAELNQAGEETQQLNDNCIVID